MYRNMFGDQPAKVPISVLPDLTIQIGICLILDTLHHTVEGNYSPVDTGAEMGKIQLNWRKQFWCCLFAGYLTEYEIANSNNRIPKMPV